MLNLLKHWFGSERRLHARRKANRPSVAEPLEVRLLLAATVEGRIWEDTNADGIRQFDEPWQNGVEVELLDSSGAVVSRVVSSDLDINENGTIEVSRERGRYRFADVPDGAYEIRSVKPTGWEQTSPTLTADRRIIDAADHVDHVISPSDETIYILDDNNSILRYDIVQDAFLSPISIGGSHLSSLDISPDGQFLLVTGGAISNSTGVVYRVDLNTNTVSNIEYPLEEGESNSFSVAVASNNKAIFTSSWSGGTAPLREIDLLTNEVSIRSSSSFGGFPHKLRSHSRVKPNSNRSIISVASAQDDFYLYDAATDSFRPSHHRVTDNPKIHVSTDGSIVAIANPQGVEILDSNLLQTEALSGLGYGGLIFAPNSDFLYVADTFNDVINIVETNNYNAVAEVPWVDPLFGVDMEVSKNGQFLTTETRDGVQLTFVTENRRVELSDGDKASVNFGHYNTLAAPVVRGRVWNDSNRNGVRETGETYLNGQVVELLDAGQNVVATQSTHDIDFNEDSLTSPETESGWYVFSNLAPGDYFARLADIAGDGQTFPSDNVTREINIPNTILFHDAHRRQAYDPASGIFFVGTEAGDLERYHVASDTLLPPLSINLPNGPFDISADGRFLFVTAARLESTTNGVIERIDLNTGGRSQITFQKNVDEERVVDIAVSNDGQLFVSLDHSSDAVVRRIDPGTGVVLADYPVDQYATFTVSPDRSVILFSERRHRQISVYDTATQTIVAESAQDGGGFTHSYAISSDNEQLASGFSRSNNVLNRELKSVASLSDGSVGFVFDPVRDVLYQLVDQIGRRHIIAYEMDSFRELYRIPVSRGSVLDHQLKITPDGRWIVFLSEAGSSGFQLNRIPIATTGENPAVHYIEANKPVHQRRDFGVQIPGVSVIHPPDGVFVAEGGTATFDVLLSSPPANPVVLNLDSSDQSVLTVSPAAVEFSPSDWHMPRRITVTSVENAVSNGDQPINIVIDPPSTADTEYASLPPLTIPVTIRDNEVTVEGRVFADPDRSAFRGRDEPWVNGQTIDAFDTHGNLLGTAITQSIDRDDDGQIDPDDENGWYVLKDLPAGSYVVRQRDIGTSGQPDEQFQTGVPWEEFEQEYDPVRRIHYRAAIEDKIERLHVPSGRQLPPIELPREFEATAVEVSPDGQSIFVGGNLDADGNARILQIDADSLVVTEFAYSVPDTRFGVSSIAATSNDKVFFTHFQGSTLRELDLLTGQISDRRSVEEETDIRRSGDRNSLLIFESVFPEDGRTTFYDVATDSFSSSEFVEKAVGAPSMAISRDGQLTVGFGPSRVLRVYDRENTVVSEFGRNVSEAAFDHSADALYLRTFNPEEIVAYSTRDFSELFRVPLGRGAIRFPSTDGAVVPSKPADDGLSRPKLAEGGAGEVIRGPDFGQVPIGFSVQHSSETTIVSETGTSDQIAVRLDSRPNSDVIINISSGDESEAVVAPSIVRLTPDNWHVAQFVTVTGVDDTDTDGDQTVHVTLTVDAGLSDDAFDALPVTTIDVTVTDSEAGVSGRIWNDDNGNGIHDSGEAFLNGQLVELRTLAGEIIETRMTTDFDQDRDGQIDADSETGWYRFDGLPDGEYIVQVSEVNALNQTSPTRSWTDSIDYQSRPVDELYDPYRDILYISNGQSGEVSRYHVATQQELSPITGPEYAAGLELSPDGQFLYIAEGTAGNAGESVVYKVDLQDYTNEKITFNTGDAATGAWGLAVTNNNKLFFTTGAAGSSARTGFLYSVDLTTMAVTQRSVSHQRAPLTRSSDRSVFAFETESSVPRSLRLYDATTDSLTEVIEIPGNSATTLWGLEQDAQLIAVQTSTHELVLLDRSLGVVEELNFRSRGAQFADERDHFFAYALSGSEIIAIDRDSRAELYRIDPDLDARALIGRLRGGTSLLLRGSDLEIVDVLPDPQTTPYYVDIRSGVVVGNADFGIAVDQIGVTETLGNTIVSESRGYDIVGVSLGRRPDSNVVIRAHDRGTGEFLVVPESVTVTPENWNQIHEFNVSAVDNNIADGDRSVELVLSIDDESSDSGFAEVPDRVLNVQSIDNESAVLFFNFDSAIVREGSTAATLTVKLSSRPTSDVVLSMGSFDESEVRVDSTLTITPERWDEPHPILLTGVDDDDADGRRETDIRIIVDASQSASAFHNSGVHRITVYTEDDETVPQILSPVDTDVDTLRPTISWTPVANADSYELWLEQLGGEANPVANPTASESAITLTEDLAVGRYRAWVRAKLADQSFGGWTSSAFAVGSVPVFHELPGDAAETRPTISWQPVFGATGYRIYASNLTSGESAIIDTVVTQPEFVPETPLQFGRHRFWVRPLGIGSYQGPWSAGADFYLGPQITQLRHSTFDNSPAFSWNSMEGVQSFQLYVQYRGTVIINEQGLTANSYTAQSPLTDGRYRWWIRPTHVSGRVGNWSEAAEWNIGGATHVTTSSAGTSKAFVEVSWTPVAASESYEIYVYNDTTQQIVHRESGLAATTQQLEPLTDGDYRAWVRSFHRDGTRAVWSPAHRFSVTSRPEFTAEPEAPKVVTFENTPTFRWNGSADADSYDIYAKREDEVLFVEDLIGNEWQPITSGTLGEWMWRVRAKDAAGNRGPWSFAAVVDTTARTVLLEPDLSNPRQPVFAWLPLGSAARYSFQLDDLTRGVNAVIREDELPAPLFQLAGNLGPGEYRAWARAVNPDTGQLGPWSLRRTFRII